MGLSHIEDIPCLVVKELVDNALDACETCRIERLDEHGLYVEDQGEGIRAGIETFATMFSVRRALVSSKYVRKPTRGALGNGLRFVTGAVLSTGGLLRVSTRGRMLDLRPDLPPEAPSFSPRIRSRITGRALSFHCLACSSGAPSSGVNRPWRLPVRANRSRDCPRRSGMIPEHSLTSSTTRETPPERSSRNSTAVPVPRQG